MKLIDLVSFRSLICFDSILKKFNTKVNVNKTSFEMLNSLSCAHWASYPLHCDLCRV